MTTDTKEEVVIKEEKLGLEPPPLYEVALLNDDYTPMEFVILVLQKFFKNWFFWSSWWNFFSNSIYWFYLFHYYYISSSNSFYVSGYAFYCCNFWILVFK